jgi:Fe-S-cluster containining protein
MDGLPAGRVSEWLAAHRASFAAEAGAEVPCGDCVGCCTSSYFIHIRPDETATLARIPKALLFRAPGLPKGHVLMGYDDKGHCPMFKEGGCSIYADRPRTCRTYDCRVFPATGLAAEADKPAIAERVSRWRFEVRDEADARILEAARASARFLREHAGLFPAGFVPVNSAQQAVLAIKVSEAFLGESGMEGLDAQVRKVLAAAGERR